LIWGSQLGTRCTGRGGVTGNSVGPVVTVHPCAPRRAVSPAPARSTRDATRGPCYTDCPRGSCPTALSTTEHGRAPAGRSISKILIDWGSARDAKRRDGGASFPFKSYQLVLDETLLLRIRVLVDEAVVSTGKGLLSRLCAADGPEVFSEIATFERKVPLPCR